MIFTKRPFYTTVALLLLLTVGCESPPTPIVKEIKSFTFEKRLNEYVLSSDIEGNVSDSKIHVRFPPERDRYGLIPTIEVTDGVKLSPPSGTPTNFLDPVVYTLEDGSGEKRYYTVHFSLMYNRAEFINFSIEGVPNIEIDDKTKMITGTLPSNTTDPFVRPQIEVSAGAVVTPASGELVNAGETQLYTIVSEDREETAEYTLFLDNSQVTSALSLSLEAESYYSEQGSNSGANRIGAGDFEKNDLLWLTTDLEGSVGYSLWLDLQGPYSGNIELKNGKGSIVNTIPPDVWNDVGNKETGEITALLSLSGTGSDFGNYKLSLTKEQYLIKSWQDLQAIEYDKAGDYRLANTIQLPQRGSDGLPDEGFNPITDFAGTLKNSGPYTIENFFIDRPNETDRSNEEKIGLFDSLKSGSEVEGINIVLSPQGVTGVKYVGGLAGSNEGSISNSSVRAAAGAGETEASIYGGIYTGGLVGYNKGTITSSNTTVNIGARGIHTGGLAGYNRGTITNSHATGNISDAKPSTGGLVGFNDQGTITNSYATGHVNSTSSETFGGFGGLVGVIQEGSVTDSHATGIVTGGTSSYVGGLVGIIQGASITTSYSTGNVTGSNSVGGLIGAMKLYDLPGALPTPPSTPTVVKNSYATGAVAGSENIGGLVGVFLSDEAFSIEQSYAIGSVRETTGSSASYKGGLIGSVEGDDSLHTVIASYWDTTTTEQLTSSKDKGEGKSSEDMKKEATYEGWDFTTIWAIDEGNNYPYFQ